MFFLLLLLLMLFHSSFVIKPTWDYVINLDIYYGFSVQKRKEFAKKEHEWEREWKGRDGVTVYMYGCVSMCVCENESIFDIVCYAGWWCGGERCHFIAYPTSSRINFYLRLLLYLWLSVCSSRNMYVSEFMCVVLFLFPPNTFLMLLVLMVLLLLSPLMWWSRQLWKRKVNAKIFLFFSSSSPSSWDRWTNHKNKNEMCKKVTLK